MSIIFDRCVYKDNFLYKIGNKSNNIQSKTSHLNLKKYKRNYNIYSRYTFF